MKKANEKVKKPEVPQAENTTRGEIYDWMQSLVFALIISIIVFIFIFRIVDVSGDSMNPTLINGDKLVVSDVFYKPKQGDIVIFRKDEYKAEALVKRVIATEGQTIEIDFDRGRVYVDGVLLDEPYIAEPTRNQLDFQGPQTVPEGCVFVMGDNRNASSDSRRAEIGMVDERLIVGKVLLRIFPLDSIGVPDGE
jgi:signal peptidase I